MFSLTGLLSLASAFFSANAYADMETINTNFERIDAFKGLVGSNFTVRGIYQQNKYYCVWTEGRPEDEIASTEDHEKCHALVNLDYDHFCNEKVERYSR